MALLALLPTEPLFGFAVEPTGWQELQSEGATLVEQMRRTRPTDLSADESVALARLARFGLRSFKLLGDAFLDVVRGQVQTALTALVRNEVATGDPARVLALRHIQQAVHRYAVLMETTCRSHADEGLAASSNEPVEAHVASMIDGERVAARFQLDVLVAITVMDAPLEELTFWAFRAITGARRVEAFGDRAAETRRMGELARARTRNAWVEWSAEDVAREISPWTAD